MTKSDLAPGDVQTQAQQPDPADELLSQLRDDPAFRDAFMADRLGVLSRWNLSPGEVAAFLALKVPLFLACALVAGAAAAKVYE